MSEFDAYRATFERGASGFVKWSLSPVLLLFAVLFSFQTSACLKEGNSAGLVIGCALVVLSIAGLLALWGVKHAGRIVTGLIGFGYAAYLIHECFVDFDGNWGWRSKRSETTPVNSILGFVIIGLPCLIYTIFGRFTIRRAADGLKYEVLFLIFALDDAKHGSSEFRSRLRDLSDRISDRVCDGINADHCGEHQDEKEEAALEFWTMDAEDLALRIRAEFPEESLLAECKWLRITGEGTEIELTNPYRASN
jgi:hypothetical protein